MLSSRSPYPLTAGYRMRIHYLAKLLSKKYDVDLLCLQSVIPEASNPSPFITVFSFPMPVIQFGLQAIRHWVKGWPLQVGGYFNHKVNNWFKRHSRHYDIIYVHHIRMAPYAAEHASCSILDYHDAISMHYQDSRNYAKGLWRLFYAAEAKRIYKYELGMLRRFTGAFINSSIDREYLLKQNQAVPHCPLEVLPMGVRYEVLNYQENYEEAPWIVMIGRMAYIPNREAAIFFAHHVYPKIKKRYKDIEFYIVGTDPTPDVQSLNHIPGVHVTGYVQDPWYYISKARVVVAPIRMGAGIQNKVLEAMALGKAIVATSLAIQGIEGGVNQHHFLVADTIEEMVEKISYLLDHKNKRKNLGSEARHLIQERYTWESIGKRLFQALDSWT